MKHPVIDAFEKKFMREKSLPQFRAGDTLRVWVKILEGTQKDGTPKYRLQAFEGICLRYKKGTTNSTFLVRKISAGGVSVERNFFVHSPSIDRIEVKARGRVRRGRLYYLRGLKGKAARIESRYVGNVPSEA